MKTRKTHRLLSLLLALVMLTGLAIVPTFAAGDEPPEKELRMVHLQWNDNGQCYADEGALDKNNGDGPVSGFGYNPAHDDAVLFFIWNNRTQKKESYVVPKGDGNLVVEKIDKADIASGAKQSSYYVHVRMNEFKDGQVTANGLSFQFIAMLDDFAFFSSQDFSQETNLSNEVNEETLTDLTLYFGNSYAGTEEADEHDKVVSVEKNENGHENLYTLEQVSDDCWKLVCKDVFAVQGGISIDLKLEVLQPDGEAREDQRGICVNHETAPELWFVWIDGEWDEKMESDIFFYNSERRDVTSSLELVPGDALYGILGYGGDWDENGFNFKGFTPVSVKDVKLPDGVTANTDVPAKKGAKWSQYYVELSSEAKDQDFTLTYKEYELTVSCRLPSDIGVYTAPEATWDSWAGPWGFPYNAVLDNEYYIISTSTDERDGRHVTDLALSAEWNKEDEEVANDGVELSKVSDGVYKLTLKDGALDRDWFHLELDITWTDVAENTYTDTNRYLGNFDSKGAIVASETALTDGTAGEAGMELIPVADGRDKVATSVTMKAGEDKTVYLYRSIYFDGPILAYMPYRGHFYSSSEDLTLTPDDKDYSKFTLSCAKPGAYEVYMGGDEYDWDNFKLFHADGKEYTRAEMEKFNEDIVYTISDGRLVVCSDWDKETYRLLSDPVPFEEMFPGETYELKSLGFNEWEWYGRLTVTVEDAVELPFADVKEEDWFYSDVAYVFAHSLMNGVGDDQFDPSGDVSRAMVPTVLYRVEGQPEAPAGAFTDVAAGQWYADAINWAAGNSIVNGMGDGIFGIEGKITHEQLATMLYRYAEYKGCDMSASNDLSAYTDADKVSGWALKQMQWAVGAGIAGDRGDSLDPQGVATRAELAAALTRLYRDVL